MSNNEISEGFNTTELGHLPDGWEVVRLGDVAKTYSGGTPKRDKQEYWGGVIQWVKSGELNNRKIFSSKEYITEEGLNSSSAKFVEENTLLIAMYGATAGKVGLAKSRFTVNQAICAIVPNKSFNSEFYFYYLMSIRDKILAERFGGAQPNLNQQIIKNLTIPLPPPLEQHRIAAVLSAVQDAKEKTGAVIATAKSLKKSLMRHLFTYGPVSIGAAESVPLTETEIGPVPEGWIIINVGEVGKVVTGTTPRTSVPEYYGGAYMFTSPGDIGEEMYVKKAEKYISEKGLKVSRPLPRDTVLVVCIGATIGKTALTSAEQSTTNQQINAIIPNEKVFAHYLYYAISHRAPYLPSLAGRAAVPIVNKSNFANFPIPLPPLTIQQKIASILSTVDKKIEAEENKKKALDELFKSLLRNLMTGKIRVNHMEMPQ
jgi:type I restriction enzyme S subunit